MADGNVCQLDFQKDEPSFSIVVIHQHEIIMLSLVSKPIRPNIDSLSPPKTHKFSVEICLPKTMGTIKDYATCGTKPMWKF